jgi:hypothetical protein
MPRITQCAFLTDVEGNFDYFDRYIEISKVLKWKDAEKTALEFKKDNTMFVFGGDSQDKGTGDIRFTKLLLALKKKYPTRVEMIIGNRDANKMRLCSELHGSTLADPKVLTDASFPYWVEEGKRVTPQMFLDKNDAANGGSENTAANRLRWMLKDTMGADGAFDRRKEELSIIKKCKKEEITDDAVVESYRDECDPKGKDNFMLQYLQQGKLACVFGTTLFVHGGLSVKNIGTVPGKKTISSVQSWVKELNAWAQKEVKDFMQAPYSGKNDRTRKGGGLTDYGSGPNGNAGATVIYTHYLENGNSKHIPKEVQKYLLESDINTVLSGHQPHGDCPNVIRTGSVKVIVADTSYSQMGSKSSWGVDNRGVHCVSEVIVNEDGSCEVHGKLADGTKIAYNLGGKDGDEFVGLQLSKDKSWIKAKIADKPEYLACLGEGFKLTPSRVTEKELQALKATDFVQPEIVTPEEVTKTPKKSSNFLSVLVVLGLLGAGIAWYLKDMLQ